MKFRITKHYYQTDDNMNMVSMSVETGSLKNAESIFSEYIQDRLNNAESKVASISYEILFEKGAI